MRSLCRAFDALLPVTGSMNKTRNLRAQKRGARPIRVRIGSHQVGPRSPLLGASRRSSPGRFVGQEGGRRAKRFRGTSRRNSQRDPARNILDRRLMWPEPNQAWSEDIAKDWILAGWANLALLDR